jgi:hypothetical protein
MLQNYKDKSDDFKVYIECEIAIKDLSEKISGLYGDIDTEKFKKELIRSINGYVRTIEDFSTMLKSTISSIGIGATRCYWEELIQITDEAYFRIIEITSRTILKLINPETVINFSVTEITNNYIKTYTKWSNSLRTAGTHSSGSPHAKRLEMIKSVDSGFLVLLTKLIDTTK